MDAIRRFFKSSFVFLNIAQFLGALNDNIFKMLIAFFAIEMMASYEHISLTDATITELERSQVANISTNVLAIAGAIFVIPFLLFASVAGTLADRYSKNRVIVWCKVLEVVTMFLGITAFYFQSIYGAFAILFVMALHSALFSPSKYGIIPEIVPDDEISKANGILSSFTYLAIIIGTFLASFLTELTGRHYIQIASVCLGIAILGLIAALCIKHTPPSGATRKIGLGLRRDLRQALSLFRANPMLGFCVLGSSYFLFAGAFIQLNVIPFGQFSFRLTDAEGGYLFLMTALGIGTGSMLAGKLSGNHIELGLVPLGGMGMVLGCLSLDLFTESLTTVVICVALIGVAGGIYIIPLDSYMQRNSPSEKRGLVVAAANFFSFTWVLMASVALFVIHAIGLHPDTAFTILAFITLGVLIVLNKRLYDYVTRYIGACIASVRFSTSVSGLASIPEDRASLIVCRHTAWNDTLLLLGTQKRPVRFFSEREMGHSRAIIRLYRVLKLVLIPSWEMLESDTQRIKYIKETLEAGISACVFLEGSFSQAQVDGVKRQLEAVLTAPIIMATIEKNHGKPYGSSLRERLYCKRIPATVHYQEA